MGKRTGKASTSVLWTNLFKSASAKTYLENNGEELGLPTFAEYITGCCRERGEVPERVIKRAGIERAFGHQIFRGIRNPSRDSVLQLAFGFEADVEQTQLLLRHAGHCALYPRIKRDATISYCLKNGYSLIETQQTLSELALPLIGGDKNE
ncbi:MAG: hypothetical protein GX417_01040 [Clostridiales bacterium]|nr:hypothetical protein [Clostridiales bacterium]